MVATNASAALAALKNTPAPKHLRVKEFDSETLAQIAVPEVKRWKSRVAKILDAMPWAWVEPLDSKGNILGPRVDNPEMGRAGELEDFDEVEPSGDMAKGLAALQGLTSLMLKAQDVALVRQRQAYSDVLDNNQKLLSVISDRLGKMEKHAQSSFDVITALHNRLNIETLNGADDDEDDVDSLAAKVMADVLSNKLTAGDTPKTDKPTGQTPKGGTQ